MFELTSSQSAHTEFSDFEIVLAYCPKKVGENVYQAALEYGRKIGFFNVQNKLSRSGQTLVQFVQVDMQDAA